MDDSSGPTMERALGAYLLQHGLPAALRGVQVDAVVQFWTDAYRAGAGAGRLALAPHGRHPGRPRLPRAPGPARAKHPTSLWLSDDDVYRLDAIADRTGHSRTEVLRFLIRLGLTQAETIPERDTRADIAPLVPSTDR